MNYPIIPPPPLPKRKYLSLILFLLLPFLSFAQEYEDIIHLKNGWVLHGTIISSWQDSIVTIQTEDRNIFTFPKNEVEKQVHQPKPQTKKRKYTKEKIVREIKYRNKGYFMLLQTGLIMGNSANFEESNVLFNPEMIHGYTFNRFLSVGGGAGMNLISNGALLPVFLDIRGDILKQKATPHYYLKGGYGIAAYSREDEMGWWGEPVFEDFKAKGGYMFESGIGMKIHTPSGLAWILSGGYRIQNLVESYTTFGETKVEEIYTYQRFTFNLGIMF